MSNLEDLLSKLVQLKRNTDGGLRAESPAAGGYVRLGAKPPAARRFFVIRKNNNFNAIGSHLARVQNHLKEIDF